MEKYNLPNNVKVFGVQVKTFPGGIGEAFDKLIQMLPPGDERSYYGISECTKEGIIYIAAALETFDGEAEKYGCKTFIVEKGDYLTETVTDWRKKTTSIRYVFEEMFKNELSDRTKPCVEIYKNNNEMLCMVKVDERKELQNEFEAVAKELSQVLSSFSDDQINITPYEACWTAGQVAQHLVLSNSGFAQLLKGPTKETERAPDELVATIKESFLNFDIKMESPDFVRPAIKDYDKESLLNSLEDIRSSIINGLQTADLSKTCVAFELPVLGLVTRLEAINFVIVHTKRHIHQLKKIYDAVTKKEVEKTF